jgi:hypothetical protein
LPSAVIGLARAPQSVTAREATAVKIRKMTSRFQSVLPAIPLRSAPLFVASASVLVLTPVALLAGVLGVWRLAADPGWTNGFFIAEGVLSRYQLWFAVSIGAQMSALVLNRWVASQRSVVPLVTPSRIETVLP